MCWASPLVGELQKAFVRLVMLGLAQQNFAIQCLGMISQVVL